MGLVDVIQEQITQFTDGANLSTSDEALDRAADFQHGFQTYIGLYNEYTGSGLTMEVHVQRPYDQLRGIDFGRLKDVAEKTARIGDDLEETLEEVNTQVGTVSGWSGDAATAFRAYIQQFQTSAQTIDESLEDIATRTAEAVPAVQSIIAEYVDGIGDIDFSGFDSPEIVQLLIRVQRLALSVGDLIRELADRIGDLLGIAIPTFVGGGGGFSWNPIDMVQNAVGLVVGSFVDLVLDWFGLAADEFLEWVAGKAREYLDRSFKEPFEANLQLLHDLVDAAERGTDEAFRPVIEVAGAAPADPFAGLPVPPEDDPNQRPGEEPGGSDKQDPHEGQTHDQPPGGQTDAPPPAGPPPGPPAGGPPAGGQADGSQPGVHNPGVQPGTDGGPVPTGQQPPAQPVVTAPNGAATQGTPTGTPTPGDGASGAGGVAGTGGDLPSPTAGMAAGGAIPSGRPGDLPPGAGWIADPSMLPQGWTVDQATGELLPPGAPGGDGDPEVHSPEGRDVLDGVAAAAEPPGADNLAAHATDGDPSSITVQDGDVKITVTADGGPADNILVTLTDGDGDTARYEVRIGDDGRPELVPVEDSAEPTAPTASDVAALATARPGGFVVADIAQSLNPGTMPATGPVMPAHAPAHVLTEAPVHAADLPAGEAPTATVAAAVGFGVGPDPSTSTDGAEAGQVADPGSPGSERPPIEAIGTVDTGGDPALMTGVVGSDARRTDAVSPAQEAVGRILDEDR